eukprot:107145-Prorocentrum_minimum.AAC.3
MLPKGGRNKRSEVAQIALTVYLCMQVLNIGWRAGEHRRCHNAVDAIVASRRGMQPPNVKSRHRAEKRTLGEKFLHQVIAKRKATRVYRDC